MKTNGISREKITGLVLSGGQGRRIQAEKGLLMLNHQTLAQNACRYLESRVSQVWISANRQQHHYAKIAPVLADDPEYGEGAGPLAGVATALKHLKTPWLLTLPVDVPWLPEEMLSLLANAVESGGVNVAYATTQNRAHPLCMLVHRDRFASLQAYLQGGDRKVRLWLKGQKAQPVMFTVEPDLFMNINTPEDLARAQQRLKG